MIRQTDPRPLVAHVMNRFDVGGLENGVVNLINRLPADRFRHAVIALTEVTGFRQRVQREDVQFFALEKPPGQGLWQAPKMCRLLRELQPTILHTRNLAALDMVLPAAWVGVPVRVHSEHGWESSDPEGRRLKYRLMRRAFRPFVHHYVALSRHLAQYLEQGVGVPASRLQQIYNGVDTVKFHPVADGARRGPIAGSPFGSSDLWLAGTVGRLDPVKDQVLMVRAFARAIELAPAARARMRLVIVGEGSLRTQVEQTVQELGLEGLVWLAGERGDVAEVLRGLDAFVLPSRAEGVSNTLLEAMATALPVVATRVGGNVELVEEGLTGRLTPSGDVDAMARAMLDAYVAPSAAQSRGIAARAAVLRRFSLDSMVGSYAQMYERLLSQAAERGALQRA